MSFAKRHNKGNRTFDIDISDYEWKTLEELYLTAKDAFYPVKGYFIKEYSKNRRTWESVVIISDNFCTYAPGFMLDDFKDMTDEDIKDIKDGLVGFSVIEKVTKDAKGNETTYYNISWFDFN